MSHQQGSVGTVETGADATGPIVSFDEISLDQALVDARVANARIVAVTTLIGSVSSELLALREELAIAQRNLFELEASS